MARQIFRSVSRLSIFDREVFRAIYERRLSPEESMVMLAPHFPGMTLQQLTDSRERMEKELTANQRWLLNARFAHGPHTTGSILEESESLPINIADPRPDPEATAVLNERFSALTRSLSRLSSAERLLIRLRFEKELTLEQCATLLGLGNAQRVDRQIKEILSR